METGTAASGVHAALRHPGADEKVGCMQPSGIQGQMKKVLGTTGIVKSLGRLRPYFLRCFIHKKEMSP